MQVSMEGESEAQSSLVSTWGTWTEDALYIFKCQFHKFEIDQLWQSWWTLGNKVKYTYTVPLLIFSFSNWQGWLLVKEHATGICILDFLQIQLDLSSHETILFFKKDAMDKWEFINTIPYEKGHFRKDGFLKVILL